MKSGSKFLPIMLMFFVAGALTWPSFADASTEGDSALDATGHQLETV
ncbi:hypothetical protein [Lentibacillus sp. CBA3610]|nr:hypothetical protein [Lentibacillus sp. CBA3610]